MLFAETPSWMHREKLAIPPNVMDQLVSGSGADIRQVINMLSTWKLGANSMDFDQGKELVALNEKSAMETPFSLYSKLSGPYAFSATSRATLTDKLELYFTDYSFLPLFVQENYLKATQFARANRAESPQEKELLTLELASKAADSISDGDLVDRMIHGSQQQWSLMPAHGILSCVRPMYHVYGQGGGFPAFPAWLGKNSMQNRMLRQLSEVQTRMKLRSTLDRNEIRQSYFRTLVDRMYTPLHIRGPDAIKEVIQFMDEYFLSKEEWDFILELGVGAYNGETLLGKLNSQTKGSFTRACVVLSLSLVRVPRVAVVDCVRLQLQPRAPPNRVPQGLHIKRASQEARWRRGARSRKHCCASSCLLVANCPQPHPSLSPDMLISIVLSLRTTKAAMTTQQQMTMTMMI